MLIFTIFIVIGKFAAITTSIFNDELATNVTEEVCAISNGNMSMVELEQRCFLACDKVYICNYKITIIMKLLTISPVAA
jgi:hypothetical protein